MTAQQPDTVDVDGITYDVVGVSGTGLFDPAGHGIRPMMNSTGCWRGYVCRYAVADAALRLRALWLGTGSTVDGARIEPGTTLLGTAARGGGAPFGGIVVEYGALDVPYTGTLLGGHGFVRETYVHMGFAAAWQYERVVELVVDGGRVTEQRDRSAELAELRARMLAGDADDPDGDRSDPGAWIARRFGRGYERTFGVPKPPERPPGT